MATKYYGIKDNWTDDDVANVIEVASEDGSVSSVKVNGVEYGGGGGGGGDATTADIIINVNVDGTTMSGIFGDESTGIAYILSSGLYGIELAEGDNTVKALLYNGKQIIYEYGDELYNAITNHTGDITVTTEEIDDNTFTVLTITGNCTITITIS